MRFTLALHTDDGVKYGVTVPDLSGGARSGRMRSATTGNNPAMRRTSMGIPQWAQVKAAPNSMAFHPGYLATRTAPIVHRQMIKRAKPHIAVPSVDS